MTDDKPDLSASALAAGYAASNLVRSAVDVRVAREEAHMRSDAIGATTEMLRALFDLAATGITPQEVRGLAANWTAWTLATSDKNNQRGPENG